MLKTADKKQQQNINQDTEHNKSKDDQIELQKEYGGPKGKEPTRYGDWEKKGRCIDF